MNLEDLFLLEQQDAAQLERKQRLKLEVELSEVEAKLSEAEAKLDEETEKRRQADSRCEEAEQEIKRLRKLLEDSDS